MWGGEKGTSLLMPLKSGAGFHLTSLYAQTLLKLKGTVESCCFFFFAVVKGHYVHYVLPHKPHDEVLN